MIVKLNEAKEVEFKVSGSAYNSRYMKVQNLGPEGYKVTVETSTPFGSSTKSSYYKDYDELVAKLSNRSYANNYPSDWKDQIRDLEDLSTSTKYFAAVLPPEDEVMEVSNDDPDTIGYYGNDNYGIIVDASDIGEAKTKIKKVLKGKGLSSVRGFLFKNPYYSEEDAGLAVHSSSDPAIRL